MENNFRKTDTTQEQIDAMMEELKASINNTKVPVKKKFNLSFQNIIFIILTVFVLGSAVKVAIDKMSGNVPSIFGYQIYQVQTGSMIPTLPINCLIVGKTPSSSADIEVNDIITYELNDNIITHRIIEIKQDDDGESYYVTKGDNPENSIDPWKTYFSQVKAKFKFVVPFTK